DRVGDVLREITGDVLTVQRNLAEALSNYNESRAITEKFSALYLDGFDWQRDLAVVYDKIADIERAQGKPDAALDTYIKGRDIRKQLVAKDATNNLWQRDLAQSHMKIGNVLTELRKFDEAKENHDSGVAIMERLSRSDPTNADWQRELAWGYDNIGDRLRTMAGPDGYGAASLARFDHAPLAQALKNYRLSLDITLRLAEAHPGNRLWQYDLGVRQGHIGELLMVQNDFAGAMKAYEAAQTIFRPLVESDPNNRSWRHNLCLPYDRLGNIPFGQHRLADALTNYRHSLAIMENLIAADPENVHWQLEVVHLHWRLATSGDDAGRRWGTIVEILQRLKAADKLPAEQTSWLSDALEHLVELQAK